jgi:hypothetical protein
MRYISAPKHPEAESYLRHIFKAVATWLPTICIASVLNLGVVASAHAQAPDPACQQPANPIVAENCQPGSDGWIISNYLGDIEGYAAQPSINKGERLGLFVNTTAPRFDMYVFRSGYYGGLGGRLLETIQNVTGTSQPACARADDVGLRTCSTWRESYSLIIKDDWVSGIYVIKLVRPDTGGENYIQFVVRNDASRSHILYQQSITTNQAYNYYGGKSTYTSNSGTCPTVATAPRAVKVSFNRPEAHPGFFAPDNIKNTYFRAEYPMVRWLEQNGYDVTYSTNMDTHRSGKPGATNLLLNHKVFLSVGHDEYWSEEMRNAIMAARDAGVHLGFFTANTGYWRVRFEPDPLTNEPDSVMVTYKTTESGPADPSGIPTGTWRDPAGANLPENSVFGVMYIGDNDRVSFPLRIASEFVDDPIYRHTGLQDMPDGTYLDVGDQIFGWEWDARVDNGFEPKGLTVLAETPVYGMLLQDAGNSANGNVGKAAAQTVRYTAPSGAIVFSTGTIQWSWGLGAHGLQVVDPDPIISQMTYNILADMRAQPATPAEGIILDGSDTSPPPLPTDRLRNASEATVPVISNIQASASGDSITVRWETDVETTGQLWYGVRSGAINTTGGLNLQPSTRHEFTVNGLDPRTTYYFKAASVGAGWEVAISDEQQVQTGSLSFADEIRHALDPAIIRTGCWVRANTAGVVIFGILGVVIALLIVGRWWLVRRSTRAA